MTVIQHLGRLFVRRFLFPAISFLGASMVASVCVSIVFFAIALWGGDEPISFAGLFSMLIIAITLGVYIAAFAAIPAMLLIWGMRLVKIRRGWTDALAGALTGAVIMHFIAHGLSAITQPPALITGLFAVAGLIGGLAYWQLAGRPRPPYAFLHD
jgi:hypothetical protein